MNGEFHYYLTYLIALRANFEPKEAFIVAYSAQYTDGNSKKYKIINKETNTIYKNYISQTANIAKPEKELMRIYPIFHFMPGTIEEIINFSASRKDGKFHVLNTIPDNTNARAVLGEAIRTKDLYRIGIAAHVFADTFAHQNFVGYYESFNSMKGVLETIIPDIGHADAMHYPDWPAHKWNDIRLITKHSEVDNKERFLLAAGRLFEEFYSYKDPTYPSDRLDREKMSLLAEIDRAIGEQDIDNKDNKNRIARYIALIKNIVSNSFMDYDSNTWFRLAVKAKGFLGSIMGKYKWREDNYLDSNWYKFQEAIKAHQKFTNENIVGHITKNLELERW